jgi:tetratricopeptide (TPR) repeat protein
MFARAIAVDPRYATAYVGLGWTYLLEWNSFWTQDFQSLEQALALAQKALALDDSLPYAHALLGNIYLLQKQYEQAVAEGERAIALDPTCADCYVTLADILTFAGRAHRALELVETARYLDPSSAAYYAAVLGRAYYLMGQPDQAIPALRRALIRNPNFLLARLNLAAAYSEVDLTKAARAQLTEGRRLNPQLSLAGLRERLPDKNPGTVERFVRALHKAGLDEK